MDLDSSSLELQHNFEDVQSHIEKHGISGIEEFLKVQLEGWKDVEINIGITGNSGVGKSSFINAIRGLADDDKLAAKTDVKECTRDAAVYLHPTNDKIKFWDLPGIGTPNYPDLPTYCKKVGLEKFDTFLILTAERFTKHDLDLAERVKSMKKSFFFIRTKIDHAYASEKRKKIFNETNMLEDIKKYCLENLKGLVDDDAVVFLISNWHPTRWHFPRLLQAILDVLPTRQRESLAMTLTNQSIDILKRKVNVFRGRIWMVAAANSAALTVAAAVTLSPVPHESLLMVNLLRTQMRFYKTQLGLPDVISFESREMLSENHEIVRNFRVTETQLATSIMKKYTTVSIVEEFARSIPFVGSIIIGKASFSATYYFLHQYLNELEKTALELLNELTTKIL